MQLSIIPGISEIKIQKLNMVLEGITLEGSPVPVIMAAYSKYLAYIESLKNPDYYYENLFRYGNGKSRLQRPEYIELALTISYFVGK